jgi:hypothetical protein
MWSKKHKQKTGIFGNKLTRSHDEMRTSPAKSHVVGRQTNIHASISLRNAMNYEFIQVRSIRSTPNFTGFQNDKRLFTQYDGVV